MMRIGINEDNRREEAFAGSLLWNISSSQNDEPCLFGEKPVK